MLDARTVAALGLRHRLAQFPHGLSLSERGRQHGVLERTGARRLFQFRGQKRGQILIRVRRTQFDQQVPRAAEIERIGDSRDVLHRHFHGDARNQLERGHLIARGGAQPCEQIKRMARRVEADQCGGGVGRPREQLERGRRDDAQRSLGADKQGFHVVSGVVLAQTLQRREHPAIGQHHLQPQHQVAHHSVAQYCGAAGIGGEVAANLRGSLRAQAQGKKTIGVACRGLRAGQRAAGLYDHRIIGGIDLPNAIQALQGHDNLRAAFVRCGAAAVTGIAAVRHHGDIVAVADRQDPRDLIDAARAKHQRRDALVEAPEIREIGRYIVVRVQRIARTHRCLEFRERRRTRRARH